MFGIQNDSFYFLKNCEFGYENVEFSALFDNTGQYQSPAQFPVSLLLPQTLGR